MKLRIVLFLCICFSLARAQNNDSLAAELKKNIPDTVKLKILTDLCWNYSASDIEKANAFAQQELELAQKINDQKYIGTAYNDLGIILIKKSKFKEALEFHKKALAVRLNLKSDLDIASSYSKLAYCYHELDEDVRSLDASLKALAIYVKLKNKLYEVYTLNTICTNSFGLKDFTTLKKYSEMAYALAIEIKDKKSEAAALHNLGSVYLSDLNYKEAIKKETAALDIYREMNYANGMAVAYHNIGFFNNLNSDYQTALPNLIKALEIAESIEDVNSIGIYNNSIANTYLQLKQYALCEKYLKRSLEIAYKQSQPDLRMMNYKTYADLCAQTNRGDQAVNYFNLHNGLRDTLYSNDIAKQYSEMNVKYETEKKETENKLLQEENELKNLQISRSNIILACLTAGILMVILISYLLFNRTKLKQKQLLDAELLKQQTLRSKAVIEAEEKERVRIARELHDGIGQQLSAAKLNISGLQDSIKTTKPEEITMLKNALDLLDESVKEVRAVSHSMLPNALIKSGLVSAVREFINKISSSGNLKINLEIVGLNNRLENTIENILFRVLQELVNNIIKHSKATEVSIQFIQHEKELTILVEDNGVGFNVQEKISDEGGIGIKNIQSRINFLNGEVIFDSYPGKGTTVTIEIPF